MSSPSPLVLVNGQSPINGINVAAGSTVTVALQDPAGVNAWSLQCTDTDGYVLASTINGSVSLDIVTKTATFTMPNYASSVLMQSTVNNGIGFSGAQDDALTIKFKVSVLTSANLRLGAMNERYENNLATGYTGLINDAIKAIGMFGGSFTAGGDLDGSSTNHTVVAIQGRAVSNAAPSVSNLLAWNGSSWAPTAAFTFAAGGDVTGSSGSLTVVKIQGRPMDVATPANGNVIAWNGTSWAPTAPASGFTAGGDLTGSSTSQTVAKVNGAAVQNTATTVGQALVVSATNQVSFAPINLAGLGITGTLPAANMTNATSSVTGTIRVTNDLGGTATAPTVVRINGTTVPAGGTLTTGHVLTVTGAATADWQAPSGGFAAGGDVTGTSGALTVAKIQGYNVQNILPSNGFALVWNSANTRWEPTAQSGSGFAAGGDLSGTSSSQTVIGINGTTVASGATTGQVLRATGANAASFGAINLATAAAITGLLPSANMTSATTSVTGIVRLTGDFGGTATAPLVLKINGTSVPATPTANTFLKASSGTAATWATIDRIQAVVVSGTAPTSGQVLTASSGTAASWVTPSGTSVTWATDLVGSTNSSQIVTAATGSAGVFNIKCAEIANSSVSKCSTRDFIWSQYNTTNATTATAYTIVTTTNSQTDIAIRMNATRDTYASGGNWTMQLTVRNVAGALTLIGTLGKTENKDNPGLALDYTFSGGTVNIRVTGVSSQNYGWQGQCSIMQTTY